jgi:hypothetical protein
LSEELEQNVEQSFSKVEQEEKTKEVYVPNLMSTKKAITVPKKGKLKTTFNIFFIKDTIIRIFMEFIHELDKIPSAEDKQAYLRKILYRNNDNRAELNIVIGYFVKRLLFSPIPTDKFLPLESDLEKDTKTGKNINFPQLDFMVEYGVKEEELRPYFEEYIYSESNYLQDFLVKFINGDNVFKVPKHLLKELWDNQKLKMQRYMALTDKVILHRHFIGKGSEVNERNFYKFMDLKGFGGSKWKDKIVLPTDGEIRDYYRERGRKARKIYMWKKSLEKPLDDTEYHPRFPVFLYKGSSYNKNPKKICYFLRYGSIIKTNIEGMFKDYFETMARRGMKSTTFLFIGYINQDNSLDVLVCSTEKKLCNSFLTEKAMKYQYSYSTYNKDIKQLKKNIQHFADEYGVRKVKLHKQQGFVFHSLHHLLNYLLLNISLGDKLPITIMFRNLLLLTNGVKYRKAVLTEFNRRRNRGWFTFLDNKEEIILHTTRISESPEIVPNFINQEVFIFNFNEKSHFALLAPMKKFSWHEEEYTEKITKLRRFNQIFEAKDTF